MFKFRCESKSFISHLNITIGGVRYHYYLRWRFPWHPSRPKIIFEFNKTDLAHYNAWVKGEI